MLDYESDHFCPVFNEVVTPDKCYDALICLCRLVKIEANPDLDELGNIEVARKLCKACPYSDLSGGEE